LILNILKLFSLFQSFRKIEDHNLSKIFSKNPFKNSSSSLSLKKIFPNLENLLAFTPVGNQSLDPIFPW